MTSKIAREVAQDGSVVVRDARCSIVFRRLRPGALEVRITGTDNGQFGDAVINEIALAIARERPLELFVDAGEASMPAVSVRQWSHFFALHRENLKHVRILVGSKAVALTMEIVRHLSKTGDLIRIYSERERYDARKARPA